MKFLIPFVLVFFWGCGSTLPEKVEHTLPEPLFTHTVPDRPDDILDTESIVPVEECIVEGSNPPETVSHGVYMSEEVAMGVARLRVAYDEMREYYAIDLQTIDREREFYERYLEIADQEIGQLRHKSRRTWWEEHGPQVMLSVGILLGVGMTVGVAAALDGVTE